MLPNDYKNMLQLCERGFSTWISFLSSINNTASEYAEGMSGTPGYDKVHYDDIKQSEGIVKNLEYYMALLHNLSLNISKREDEILSSLSDGSVLSSWEWNEEGELINEEHHDVGEFLN